MEGFIRYDFKKQEQLMEFDRELISYTGQITWLLPCIFGFIEIIFALLPGQIMWEDAMPVSLLCFIWAIIAVTGSYIQSYMVAFETKDGKKYPISLKKVMRAVPIAQKDIILVRMRYIIKLQSKITAIMMVAQCVVAAIAECLSLWNVVYILIIGFVIPVAWARLQLAFECR